MDKNQKLEEIVCPYFRECELFDEDNCMYPTNYEGCELYRKKEQEEKKIWTWYQIRNIDELRNENAKTA